MNVVGSGGAYESYPVKPVTAQKNGFEGRNFRSNMCITVLNNL